MKFKRKHYVVICEYAVEELIPLGVEISGVAHSFRKAKEILARASADEKKYAEINGWEIRVNSDAEFYAGDANNYESDYAHFYIKEV